MLVKTNAASLDAEVVLDALYDECNSLLDEVFHHAPRRDSHRRSEANWDTEQCHRLELKEKIWESRNSYEGLVAIKEILEEMVDFYGIAENKKRSREINDILAVVEAEQA
jgi:hypothetical protein